MNILQFESFFDEIDQTPAGYPGQFGFWIPNAKAFARWPGFPTAATPESGRAASGRGLDPMSSTQSGLGEAVELTSTCFWGDEAVVHEAPETVSRDGIMPWEILGYSAHQIAERENWNTSYHGEVDWIPPPCGRHDEIAWVTGFDATTGNPCFLPADAVLVGRRKRGEHDAAAIANTSGCAAAATPDAAKLSALLELIERDAVGRWWYGTNPCPRLADIETVLPADIAKFLAGRQRRTVAFDITTDLGVPVVAGVSWDKDGGDVAMGFAARANAAAAAVAALIEMLQTEIGLVQREALDDQLFHRWRSLVNARTPPLAISRSSELRVSNRPQMPTHQLNACLQACADRNIRIAFFDHTRPEFQVPVFRAVSSGLCSDKPRWGHERLYLPAGEQGPLQTPQSPANPIPLMV